MNNNMLMDIDPLSSYEAQYDYPLPNPHFYPHPLQPNNPYPYKTEQTPNYPQPYQPVPPESTHTPNIQDNGPEMAENTQTPKVDEDVKPDIVQNDDNTPKRGRKKKGKTSNYWNKKITDKDFAFYGCSVCDIAYVDLQDLDQHVIIHSNRVTSYDLRIQNMKKRKRIRKEKKKQKRGAKVKLEVEVEIKPEDGYIGTEKASEFSGEDNKNDVKKACTELATKKHENNENSPVNNKNVDNGNINVYKCFGCNKQFALSYYLRIHVRSHTDEKPYTCSVCGQSFITASKLNRHNKRIHLAVRHQCRICFKYFSRFNLLVKHFDAKHAEDKLDGEPYDYNAILPYLNELEDQLKQEKGQEPKTEELWDIPLTQLNSAQPEIVAKQEIFISKEEDNVILPSNTIFYDETKESFESKELKPPLPTANITLDEIKLDIEIKQEMLDEDDHTFDQANHDQDGDNHCNNDQSGDDHFNNDQSGDEQGNHDQSGDDDDDVDVKHKRDPGTDDEYFPSDTWAKVPSPLPQPATPRTPRRTLSSSCQICNKKLSSKSYLRVHMRTHTGEKPFSCYICKRGFITASKMHRHVLRHDESWEGKDEKKVKIEGEIEVKVEAGTEENAKKTKKKSAADKALAPGRKLSPKPKKTFFEKKPKAHKKWPHVCEFCHQRFLHVETLQVHKKSHEGTDLMKCHYCLEPQPDLDALKEHEGSHTGLKPYLCNLCGNAYKKKSVMLHHRKTRCKPGSTDYKSFICDICSKRYNSQAKLQRHIITHSVSKFTFRYECPVCAHMFHTRYHVQMHLRSHIKEGLILEENRNAVLAMVLQNARKIPKNTGAAAPALPDVATDERSRICNICGQIFQHFYYLEEHLKTHGSKIAIQDLDQEEEKKFTCQVCSKSFKLHYYLKLHSYTHTKEKPFICQQCGKGFITRGKLKRHMETHQGLKKYQCHICYKFFTRPSYLRIHVRTIHGTQDYNFRDYGVPIGLPNN